MEMLHIAYVIVNKVYLTKLLLSHYDYHFIIKKIAEEFRGQFNCSGEHTEKYITFSVPVEKDVTRIDKNGKEIIKTISYRLQFIDKARFMARSLSGIFNIFLKKLNKLNVNTNMIKNVRLAGFNTKISVLIT